MDAKLVAAELQTVDNLEVKGHVGVLEVKHLEDSHPAQVCTHTHTHTLELNKSQPKIFVRGTGNRLRVHEDVVESGGHGRHEDRIQPCPLAVDALRFKDLDRALKRETILVKNF